MTSITVTPLESDYAAARQQLRRADDRPLSVSAIMAGLRPGTPERHLALAAALKIMLQDGRVVESWQREGKSRWAVYSLAPEPAAVVDAAEVFDPNV